MTLAPMQVRVIFVTSILATLGDSCGIGLNENKWPIILHHHILSELITEISKSLPMDDVEGLKQLKDEDGGPAEEEDEHHHRQHRHHLENWM